jgi:hypothetical protein
MPYRLIDFKGRRTAVISVKLWAKDILFLISFLSSDIYLQLDVDIKCYKLK